MRTDKLRITISTSRPTQCIYWLYLRLTELIQTQLPGLQMKFNDGNPNFHGI